SFSSWARPSVRRAAAGSEIFADGVIRTSGGAAASRARGARRTEPRRSIRSIRGALYLYTRGTHEEDVPRPDPPPPPRPARARRSAAAEAGAPLAAGAADDPERREEIPGGRRRGGDRPAGAVQEQAGHPPGRAVAPRHALPGDRAEQGGPGAARADRRHRRGRTADPERRGARGDGAGAEREGREVSLARG